MFDDYELEIDVAAPRERVWRALTESRELERWFCEHADVSLAERRYDFWGRFTPGNPARQSQELLDAEPMRVLRFRFPFQDADTTVEVSLDGDTRVRVLHRGVPGRREAAAAHVRHLWSFALVRLRGYLERGDAGPRFDYTWPHVGGFEVRADVPAPPDAVFPALVEGWENPEFRRPARHDGEDFAWDVGILAGVKVLDVVPDERFEIAWMQPDATVLTYTLEGSEGRTRVTLVHSGFAPTMDEQGVAEGFFEGLVGLYWRFARDGAWQPPASRLGTSFPQSGWRLGVRVLQSG